MSNIRLVGVEMVTHSYSLHLWAVACCTSVDGAINIATCITFSRGQYAGGVGLRSKVLGPPDGGGDWYGGREGGSPSKRTSRWPTVEYPCSGLGVCCDEVIWVACDFLLSLPPCQTVTGFPLVAFFISGHVCGVGRGDVRLSGNKIRDIDALVPLVRSPLSSRHLVATPSDWDLMFLSYPLPHCSLIWLGWLLSSWLGWLLSSCLGWLLSSCLCTL